KQRSPFGLFMPMRAMATALAMPLYVLITAAGQVRFRGGAGVWEGGDKSGLFTWRTGPCAASLKIALAAWRLRIANERAASGWTGRGGIWGEWEGGDGDGGARRLVEVQGEGLRFRDSQGLDRSPLGRGRGSSLIRRQR
ncbi:MAG: hypothetical protein LQ351_006496, partial [Letrouitia transgressa]